jgi:peptide/nickel transport system substrate-binding protein
VHQLDLATRRAGHRRRWSLALAAAAALTLAACGGDDGDATTETTAASATSAAPTTAATSTSASTSAESSAPPSTAAPASSTSAAPDEETPTQGGDATVLVFNEIGSVDPVTATGAAGADGQRMFALYGALVAYDAAAAETQPVLAESLTHGDDLASWTLTLRDGITFSDGTPFDAAAVKANWERAKDPANRSQAIGLANSMSALTAVDARTLQITLAAPNAHFDNGIARQALNYIASPAAFAGGTLPTTPVGAGPFLLESWLRDDRMELTANPDWKGSDGPYLDRLTFRIVGDETQRVDTFTTGDADLFFTAVPASVEQAMDEGAAGYASVAVSGGGTVVFNTASAPFDDVRVRRAIAIGVDAAAVVDAIRPGAVVATNPVVESSPWHTPDADYPAYDPDEAQRLFDEYRAETGSDVSFTLGSFQQTENIAVAEFIQTALNQYEGVDVQVDAADAPTATGRVLQRDYQAHLWGFPVLDADPGLFNALHSGLPTNVTGYTNAAVDALLDEARITTANDERATLYQDALVQYVADMPFWHTLHPAFGYVYSDRVGGIELYEDGNLRSDLLFVRD